MTSQYPLGDIHPDHGKEEGHVHTTALPEEHADYGTVKSRVTLTQIDEGDMYRLGKQQELNVRKYAPSPCAKRPTLTAPA